MTLQPPAGDVTPPGQPDVGKALRVPDELLDLSGARGAARNPRVESDRHHPGARLAFAVQAIERRAQRREEIVRIREAGQPRRRPEAAVGGVHRTWQGQEL